MANAIYPKWKELALGLGLGSGTKPTGTLKAALVDTGTYTYSSAHDYYNDVSAGVVGTPVEITNPTYTNGSLDGDDITFSSVSGNTVEAIVIYLDTGVAGTSPLLSYQDTNVTNLPATPNGGDITITWDTTILSI